MRGAHHTFSRRRISCAIASPSSPTGTSVRGVARVPQERVGGRVFAHDDVRRVAREVGCTFGSAFGHVLQGGGGARDGQARSCRTRRFDAPEAERRRSNFRARARGSFPELFAALDARVVVGDANGVEASNDGDGVRLRGYGVSMTTLEEIFLRLAEDDRRREEETTRDDDSESRVSESRASPREAELSLVDATRERSAPVDTDAVPSPSATVRRRETSGGSARRRSSEEIGVRFQRRDAKTRRHRASRSQRSLLQHLRSDPRQRAGDVRVVSRGGVPRPNRAMTPCMFTEGAGPAFASARRKCSPAGRRRVRRDPSRTRSWTDRARRRTSRRWRATAWR